MNCPMVQRSSVGGGNFYTIPSHSWKAYPPRREDVTSHPVSGWKKAIQFDFIPTWRLASDFANPTVQSLTAVAPQVWQELLHQYQRRNCLFSCLSLLAASVAWANILVSASSRKQGASEDISQAGNTKTELIWTNKKKIVKSNFYFLAS